MRDAGGIAIGELAARTGRSVHTIRWYDAQGLIPGVVRDGGGRRVFSARHVQWLALLERLRGTGMSVAQMRAYTVLVQQGRASLEHQRHLLAAHRDRVAQTIADWQAALALIDAKLDYYAVWIATGKRPEGETARGKAAAISRLAVRERRMPPVRATTR